MDEVVGRSGKITDKDSITKIIIGSEMGKTNITSPTVNLVFHWIS